MITVQRKAKQIKDKFKVTLNLLNKNLVYLTASKNTKI